MRLEYKIKDATARTMLYYFRRRYNSRADLPTLAKRVLYDIMATEALRKLEEDTADFQRGEDDAKD